MDEGKRGLRRGASRWKWRPGADRNMWQRLGGYPKAIVERNPSGARESQRGGARGDPSLKRGKRGGGRKESPRHRLLLCVSLSLFFILFPSSRPLSLSLFPLFISLVAPRGDFRRPNRWANFFAAQFNEASLNSLPGAADRSRGTDGGRAAGGLVG